jgi:S1-C subfamily serine protease
MGVSFQPINPQIAQRYGLPAQWGVYLTKIASGSPAEKAGLKIGQMIQAVDGETLEDASRLPEIIAGHKVGDTVTLSILDPGEQNNQAREVQVKIGGNPDKAGQPWLGIRFTAIDINTNPEK